MKTNTLSTHCSTGIRNRLVFVVLVALLTLPGLKGYGQGTETFPAGSFIVNMGVLPQTVGNALKPYGMVYDLVINYGIPIRWIIDTNKVKDGIDFTYAGIDYRGGPFIIPGIYRDATIDARIAYWQTQGVVGVTTTSPLTVPVFKTITVSSAPRWTLDKQSGSIVAGYFVNAGIPASAHGGASSNDWKLPAELNECDDVFAMPHADPKWATHQNLLAWNRDHKGSIWTACHSGSALELMFNPANPSEQTNFLSLKTGNAGGAGPWASPNNSLIIWGSHSNGTPPYQYFRPGDPVMQFMGIMDGAMLNGSEQIYIPVQLPGAGWRPSTVIGILDPDHPQATLYHPTTAPQYAASPLMYGYAYGDTTRGMVMYEAGHSHNKAQLAPNIAAQRAFFNFSLLAAKEKEPDPEVNLQITNIYSGTTNNLSFTLQGNRDISEFNTILWTSTCGGTFTPNDQVNTVFVAPVVSTNTNCIITITLTDGCNRIYKSSTGVVIECSITLTSQVVNPCFTTPGGGAIVVNVGNAAGPYNYSWTRTGGGLRQRHWCRLTVYHFGAECRQLYCHRHLEWWQRVYRQLFDSALIVARDFGYGHTHTGDLQRSLYGQHQHCCEWGHPRVHLQLVRSRRIHLHGAEPQWTRGRHLQPDGDRQQGLHGHRIGCGDAARSHCDHAHNHHSELLWVKQRADLAGGHRRNFAIYLFVEQWQ
jgi:hypothetical protein